MKARFGMRVLRRNVRWAVGMTALALGGCVPDGGRDHPDGTTFPESRRPPMASGSGTGGSAGGGPLVGGPPLTGVAVSAAKAPPPISGGTLMVLADGKTALATDPDRDAVYLADLTGEALLAALPLSAGDQPGRAVEDPAGAVHVVLRGGGAVVTVDPKTRTLGARRPVCPAPRGIAHDAATGTLHVACAGGELVALPVAGGPAVQRARIDRDLRDIVVRGDKLLVTQFRSAELLVVSSADGRVLERRRSKGSKPAANILMSPQGPLPIAIVGVAWRMRALPDGSVAVIHHETTNSELGTEMGGYGGGPCRAPMGAAVTRFGDAAIAATTSSHFAFATLPVDFAYSRDGKRMAIVNAAAGAAGAPIGKAGPSARVYFMDAAAAEQGGCVFGSPPQPPAPDGEVLEFRQPVGDPIAVAFDAAGRLLVQTREPARIEILTHRGGTIKLSDESRLDTGHAIFHSTTGSGLACASCHPEGGDDGRVWRFAKIGGRRTQNLRGGIVQTAPFHWDGDMRDMNHLMEQVFTGRMGGAAVGPEHLNTLSKWLDQVPALPVSASADPAAVERGRALFNDTKVACATCHGGPLSTTNLTVDVGTGGPRQVPSLKGIASRAPFMSNGCAPTLQARFDPACGGGDKHGVTSHLDATALADLIAYMETL